MTPRLPCPTCQSSLLPQMSKGIEVDSCPECGGLWFDPGEFDELVAARFSNAPVEDLFELAVEAAESPILCPRDGTPMGLIHFGPIELDRCGDCGGIWLDAADRETLRDADGAVKRPEPRATHTEHFARWDEAETLELADIPLVDQSQVVQCGGCGESVPLISCQKLFSDHWCESCVVAGDVPGGTGRTVGQMQAEAALAFAQAKQKQDQSREAGKRAQKLLNAPARRFGRHRLPPEAYAEFAEAVEAAVFRVRVLFSRKPKP